MAAIRVGKAGRGEGEAFWRFSLALYAWPGVAPALIALQDRDGRDVNMILYALWLAIARGRVFDAAGLAAAEQAGAPLRDTVIVELRALRRRLRSNPDPGIQTLRHRIQALELAAERQLQGRLAALALRGEPAGARDALAVNNLAVCLGDAAASAEADTLRQAVRDFSRRF